MKHTYKNILVIIAILIAVAGINACKRAAEVLPIPDLTKPVIKITTPTNQTTHNSEEPIHFVGTITDDKNLGTLSISVLTADSLKQVFVATPNVRYKTAFAFHEQILRPTQGGVVPYILAVTATDSSGNQNTDSLDFILY
jgi:Domain of unknown function (DUF4625)